MGLCKCPKRKTTSHFCFHHCVNVCEHCIVNNHNTCVVKSYTTWLKESSATSTSSSSASALCAVCQKQFVLTQKEIENLSSNINDYTSNSKTAIRLLCYHIVHARCLSVSVKKQLKEGNIVKCPSCAQPFWTQQKEKSKDSNDIIVDDVNELSPVALQLYKYLLNHGDWWGQALISNNANVKDIEKFLLDDEDLYEESTDEESQQLFENLSNKPKTPINNISNNVSPSTLVQTIQSPNSNTSYYNLNSSDLIHTPDLTTMNHRNTYQASQPIYNRHFNNNYGIDTGFVSQQQQQYQCSTVNMTTISPNSDLSNRHTITSSTPLLNNDNNLSFDEEKKDPSSKYRPKKCNNQSWFSNYQRLLQYFCGTNNRSEDSSTTRITIIIIFCIFIMVILLVSITNYTRSNNEPFDNNSIDYGGGESQENGAAHVKNYNINNL